MASKFLRRQQWWVKFRHHETGTIIRESLETHDEVRAELVRARIELQARLLEPRYRNVSLPDKIQRQLALERDGKAVDVETGQVSVKHAPAGLTMKVRTTMDEAIAAYINYIGAENSDQHIASKLSMMRRLLGDARVELLGGPVKGQNNCHRTGTSKAKPFFTGSYLDELTPIVIQQFIEGLGLARKA